MPVEGGGMIEEGVDSINMCKITLDCFNREGVLKDLSFRLARVIMNYHLITIFNKGLGDCFAEPMRSTGD